MSKEAALILGVVAAVVNAIVVVAGAGAFDDGLQWEDLIPILVPVAAALGIRQQVFSQETVSKMAAELKPIPPKNERTGGTRLYDQGGKGPG